MKVALTQVLLCLSPLAVGGVACAIGDFDHDGKSDSAAVEFLDKGQSSDCKSPVLDVKFSSGRVIRSSAPFVEDCSDAPVTYQLAIKNSKLELSMFQETQGARVDVSFRANSKNPETIALVSVDRYAIVPGPASNSRVTSIDFIKGIVVVKNLAGDVICRQRAHLSPIGIDKIEPLQDYFPALPSRCDQA